MQKSKLFSNALAAAAASSLCTIALADTVTVRPIPRTIDPSVADSIRKASAKPRPILSRVELRPRDTRNDLGPDNVLRTPTVALDETSVLNAFRLNFANGDHHVKHVSVMRDGAKARGAISDNNEDDNYSFTASWWNLPGATSGEISGKTRNRFAPIPAGPAGTTLALTGFQLTVQQDDEVRGLNVNLNSAERVAQFDLSTTGSGLQEIAYTIQYAWVPNVYIGANHSIAGGGLGDNSRTADGATGTVPDDNQYILRGFHIHYADANGSAQNLREVAINLTPGAGTAPRELVSWQDNDRTERINWRVHYSTLQDPTKK
jgi:hypothetical protein